MWALRLPHRLSGGGEVEGWDGAGGAGLRGHRARCPPGDRDRGRSEWRGRAPAGFCQNGGVPTREQIIKALEAVIDPELRRSIVELGMVRSAEIGANGVVDVTVSLTTAGCPIRSHFQTPSRRSWGSWRGWAM